MKRSLILSVLAIFLFLFISLLPRLWHLQATPVIVDEPANIRDIDILLRKDGFHPTDFQWDPSQATLFYYPTIFFIKLGISDKLLALRYSSILFSLIALVSFFYLVKKATNIFIAFCTTLLLSSSYYFLQFSRVGWSAMSSTALGLLLLAILYDDKLSLWIRSIFGGLIVGILFYGYRGGSVYLIGSLLFFVFSMAKSHLYIPKRIAFLFLYISIFFLTSFPWLRQIWQYPDKYNLRYRVVSVSNAQKPYHGMYNDKQIIWYQITTSFKSWFLFLPYDGGGVENSRYLPLTFPAISIFLLPLFFIGIAVLLKKISFSFPWFFTYFLGITTGQILTVDPPNGARGLVLLPLAYFFIGVGIYSVYKKINKRSFASLFIFLFTLITSMVDILFYFWWMSWIKIY